MKPRPTTLRSRRACTYATSLLLGGTAAMMIAALPSASLAETPDHSFVVAQAPTIGATDKEQDKAKEKQKPRDGRREPAKSPTAQPKQSPSNAQKDQKTTTPTTRPTDNSRTKQPAAAKDVQHKDGRANDGKPAATGKPDAAGKAGSTTAPAAKQQTTTPPATRQTRPSNTPTLSQPNQQQTTTPANPQIIVPGGRPAAQGSNSVVIAPAAKPRDASEFIRREGGQPSGRKIEQLRGERHETREGNSIVIREGDRAIIREGNARPIIRHSETSRFSINARNVQVEHRGGNIETIIERPNGVRIVNVTDANGRLIRRVRRERGRDIVIVDNSFLGARGAVMFVQLPPPVIRIPRERYILEAGRARPQEIYDVFMEPPVEALPQRYSLEQVRFSEPLRERMPRVDLDINFDTGSWELSPDQVSRLAAIADGINRAIQRNPQEVFMIEGHTDAVGTDVDNLSLSDRRAEAVAVALTEQFQVPPENLVTQGYGEQFPKVPTVGPERANRRVAVRRITPLIDQQAQAAPPRR